jgi:hypothetical protein
MPPTAPEPIFTSALSVVPSEFTFMLETLILESTAPDVLINLSAVAPVKLLPVIVRLTLEPIEPVEGEIEEMTGPVATDTIP